MKFSIRVILFTLLLSNLAYAQTASILPPAKTTFVDQNGKPLTSGTVDFYIPSTTTRKATWQDAGETILNTNPVVLDAAGRALILGSGSYRQIVKDRNQNIIWDQVTSSSGTGGSTPVATGDGDLVGTIKPWAGMTAPNQYMLTYGQEVSRTTYSVLFTAITSTQAVFCNSGSAVLTGLTDTTNFWIGNPVEISCVVSGNSTIISKTSTTVTLAANANVTTGATAVFFPWGRGNGSTTFNLPDLRGLVPVGNNNMGGVPSVNLTDTYFGPNNPNSIGAKGGIQSQILISSNLPSNTPSGTITNGAITSTFTGISGQTGLSGTGGSQAWASGGFASSQISGTVISTQASSTFTGNNNGGASVAFSVVSPSKTANYIIKVIPDTNSSSASGVTALGGMTGNIACGSNVVCTGNIVSVSLPPTPPDQPYQPITGLISDAYRASASIASIFNSNALTITGGIGPCIVGQTIVVPNIFVASTGGVTTDYSPLVAVINAIAGNIITVNIPAGRSLTQTATFTCGTDNTIDFQLYINNQANSYVPTGSNILIAQNIIVPSNRSLWVPSQANVYSAGRFTTAASNVANVSYRIDGLLQSIGMQDAPQMTALGWGIFNGYGERGFIEFGGAGDGIGLPGNNFKVFGSGSICGDFTGNPNFTNSGWQINRKVIGIWAASDVSINKMTVCGGQGEAIYYNSLNYTNTLTSVRFIGNYVNNTRFNGLNINISAGTTLNSNFIISNNTVFNAFTCFEFDSGSVIGNTCDTFKFSAFLLGEGSGFGPISIVGNTAKNGTTIPDPNNDVCSVNGKSAVAFCLTFSNTSGFVPANNINITGNSVDNVGDSCFVINAGSASTPKIVNAVFANNTCSNFATGTASYAYDIQRTDSLSGSNNIVSSPGAFSSGSFFGNVNVNMTLAPISAPTAIAIQLFNNATIGTWLSPSATTGIPIVSNGTTFVSGQVTNAGLTNPATTVNSQTCTLGSTCTVTAAPSGAAGGSLAGTYPNPTLSTTITAGGPIGSATSTPVITYSVEGRLTAVSSATITPSASSITSPAALTKVDDTNITLTLGGSPTIALLAGVSITAGFTGTLANSRLATMTANTIKGNSTSGVASPADLAIGSCSTSASALIWTNNTGFGCNTAIAASTATTATTATTSTNATNGATIATSTNASFFPLFAASSTNSNQPFNLDTTFTYNPSTDTLTATNFAGNAATATTVVTNANLTGDVTSIGNATTLTNAPVIAKVLTGYTSGAGTISSADSILTAIQKLNGNDALKATIITPTFTTNITTPLVIGGTSASSTLTLESTSGAGTTDSIIFQTGSQVVSARIISSTKATFGTISAANVFGNLVIGVDTGAIELSGSATNTQFASFNRGGSAYLNHVHQALSYDFQLGLSGSAAAGNGLRIWNSQGASLGVNTDPGVAGSLLLNGQLFVPNITTSSAAQSGTVCWATGTGKFTADTTLGCLTSSARFKNILGEVSPQEAIDITRRLRTVSFTRKPEFGGNVDPSEQFGFTAEQAASVDERLIARDQEGLPLGVRYAEFTSVLAAAIRALYDRLLRLETVK